jgi:hypothetical protein
MHLDNPALVALITFAAGCCAVMGLPLIHGRIVADALRHPPSTLTMRHRAYHGR